MNDTLLLKRAASIWEEGYPVGNGKIGGMVFGKTKTERIALNIDELWSGYGKEKIREHGYETLYEIRKKMRENDPVGAEKLMKEKFLNEWNESYLPLGDLYIQYGIDGEIKNYSRFLELEKGTAICEFEKSGIKIREQVFCSRIPETLCVKISANSKLKLEFWLDSILRHNYEINGTTYSIYGTAPSNVQPNYIQCEEPVKYMEDHKGMGFCAMLDIIPVGGRQSKKEGKIVIEGTDTVFCYLTAVTGYDMEMGSIAKSLEETRELCESKRRAVRKYTFNRIYGEHVKEFSALYKRMDLSVGGDESFLPTDVRLENFWKDGQDEGIIELFFHYGRYLLISCSREGTMAANLQGIWNDKMRAPWSSNYTTNINLQMNYWMAEKANLSEMHLPLFELLSHCVESGRKTAREQFGCRGWVANHNIDAWYQTSPVGAESPKASSKYGYFPTASGWLCLHIWEHYLYTGDRSFAEKYYLVLMEACLFYLDYLQEKDGKYVTIPSTSPENLYYNEKGEECALSSGSTMDMAIIRMLFRAGIQFGRIFDRDEALCREMEKMIQKMPDYQIADDGSLMEWEKDYREVYPNHRHLSHMIGLYPGRELEERKEFWSACGKTLEKRGPFGPAWSKVWKCCLFARLRNGEKAYEQLRRVLEPMGSTEIEYSESGCLPNLLCTPPFQIDGNLGAPAAIMEMLVADREGEVELLPAIPEKWKNGYVTGMKIYGGHELSFWWENGKVYKVALKGGKNEKFIVKMNNEKQKINLESCRITNILTK